MADLKLTLAMNPYDRILPLINGEVKPDGITLEYMGMPEGNPRVFYEMIKFQRYDISEMSFSSFLRMRSTSWPYLALPVFHHRGFSHTYIHIRKDAGIRQGHPEDLKGKRMGVGDYQQTMALWQRGVLQNEFGVKPSEITWFQERGEHFSHTGASVEAGLPLPSNVTLKFSTKDFDAMFADGELDASMWAPGARTDASGLDRRQAAIYHPSSGDFKDIVPLFADSKKEAVRYFKKTGIFPIHHTTAVRESILEQHPWVAVSLMEAFEESKRIAIDRLHSPSRSAWPWSLLVFSYQDLKELDEIFGPDPYPYGIKVNSKAIEMTQKISVQQELTKSKQPWDEIFPQEVIYREERLQ